MLTTFNRSFENFKDIGMIGHALHIGVMVNAAEALGEVELLFRRDVLILEKYHAMIQQRLMNGVKRLVVQILR